MVRFIERFAHPILMGGAYALWSWLDRSEMAILIALLATLSAMLVLEWRYPAMPEWRLRPGQKMGLTIALFVLLVASQLVVAAYDVVIAPTVGGVGAALGLGWPTGWPMLVQVLMLFFGSDLLFYWIHRAVHRVPLLWRVSGHGVHHAFTQLHAVHFGLTHPFELFWLALPMLLIAGLFGAPSEAVIGATVLLVVNSSLAHANLRIETPGLSWLFTMSNHHRRHHSVVFAESNSNYACNAIIWDRLFGTYGSGEVKATGIGPRQPSGLEMLLMPFREPPDAETVSSSARAPGTPAGEDPASRHA